MEHIVQSLNKAPELSEYIQAGYDDLPEDGEEHDFDSRSELASDATHASPSNRLSSSQEEPLRSSSRTSTIDGNHSPLDGEHVTPEMESRFFNTSTKNKRTSGLSMSDVADRHLREQTDAIAYIIRNISDQCAAAVEGLQLAHDAEHEEDLMPVTKHGRRFTRRSQDSQDRSVRTDGSEIGDMPSESGIENTSFLSADNRDSSIPPTPDLEQHRSSTSMSVNSSSTVPTRHSQQYTHSDIVTKIVQGDEESERGSEAGHHDEMPLTKQAAEDISRPATARVIS